MKNQKNKIIFYCIAFTLMFLSAKNVLAAAPALNFSDLVNGPKSGLNDGLGQGAIVTIWGNNLGSSQGSSKVYFKDSAGVSREAAHVYYWKNADGQLPGGPSDLYTYHKMQEIAFSIPSAVADGAGKIFAEVNGIKSSELDFYARSNGKIYFVKGTGNNSTGNGSWSNPWATFGYKQTWPTINDGASTKMFAGDIAYGYDVTESGGVGIRVTDGTNNNQIAIVSYPGHPINVNGSMSPWNIADRPTYWVFSKISVTTLSSGIAPLAFGRAIGNKVWDGSAEGNSPGVDCAEGSSSAIGGGGDQEGSKIFGNYIHDFGCYNTSNQHHTTYFSVRNHGSDIEPFEMGWNYLRDNQARGGIHFYDEHDCWGYTGTLKIHNNIVKNQVGAGFNIGSACNDGRLLTGDFDIYNNIFIETGQLGLNNGNINTIILSGDDTPGYFKFYNNLIYGYGYASANPAVDEAAITVSTVHYNYGGFAGQWDFANNVVVDTHNFKFFTTYYPLSPSAASNNIWYNGGDGNPASAPAWDTNPITSNPLFVNPSSNNFALQSTSPAINAGWNASAVLAKDFLGLSRPQGSGYDIGAFEYDENTPADTVAPNTPSGLSVQ